MTNYARRDFLRSLALTSPLLGSLTPLLLRAAENAPDEKLPPVRQITTGPRFHWFG